MTHYGLVVGSINYPDAPQGQSEWVVLKPYQFLGLDTITLCKRYLKKSNAVLCSASSIQRTVNMIHDCLEMGCDMYDEKLLVCLFVCLFVTFFFSSSLSSSDAPANQCKEGSFLLNRFVLGSALQLLDPLTNDEIVSTFIHQKEIPPQSPLWTGRDCLYQPDTESEMDSESWTETEMEESEDGNESEDQLDVFEDGLEEE